MCAIRRGADQLDTLLEPLLKSGQGVCLICFERDPRQCHRAVLAAAWSARHGAAILHLGNAEPGA
jgi:uncharacterized protein (DUF488 family)